jgi:hypothetical protein
MQQRDEDLAAAYDRINRLEKRGLKFIIAIIALAGAWAVFIAFMVCRFFKIIP